MLRIKQLMAFILTGLLAACSFPGLSKPTVATPTNTGTPVPSNTAAPTATVPASSDTPTLSSTTSTSTSLPSETAVQAGGCPTSGLAIADWPVYCNDPLGFYIQYPPESEWIETEPDTIRADLPIQPGTNLGEKYVEIAIRPGDEPCVSPLGAGYAPGSLEIGTVMFNGVEFLKESGADAGVGNIWNWTAYSTPKDGHCISFDFVLHSTNPLNYPTPPPEFDVEAELAVFEEIVNTFHWYTP